MSEEGTPGIGHNQPKPLQDVVADEVLASEKYKQFLATIDQINVDANTLPTSVTTDDDAAAYGEVIQKCVAERKAIDGQRDSVGRPHLLAKRAIDGLFGQLDQKIVTIESRLREPVTAYVQKKAAAERARLEAEAQKKLAEERAAREAAESAKRNVHEKVGAAAAATAAADTALKKAAAPTADLARVRGARALVGGREKTTIEVDRATVDLNALRPYIDHDALEKAARAAIKALGKDDAIPGVTVRRHTEAFVR